MDSFEEDESLERFFTNAGCPSPTTLPLVKLVLPAILPPTHTLMDNLFLVFIVGAAVLK